MKGGWVHMRIMANNSYYYPYRAFGGQNKTTHALWGGQYLFNIGRAIFFNIARTLCAQS